MKIASKNNIPKQVNFDFADWLRQHYLDRRQKNKAYSRRAFARDLGIGSGRLSEYMSRKRKASAPTLLSLVEHLEPTRAKAQKILHLACDKSSQLDRKRLEAYRLSDDQFTMISEGVHFAILSLMTTKNFEFNTKTIATKLKYDSAKISEAWERLERLGFVSFRDDEWHLSYPSLTTSEDISSVGLRRAHREILKMAEKSLDTVPVNLREITSATMAIDPKNLPAAKRLIREFRDKLVALLENGDRQEVYELEIGLFPHTGL